MMRSDDLALVTDEFRDGYRVSGNPDTFVAQAPKLAFDRESGSKIGTDATLEKIADGLLSRK